MRPGGRLGTRARQRRFPAAPVEICGQTNRVQDKIVTFLISLSFFA
jgi:hypothetical protein